MMEERETAARRTRPEGWVNIDPLIAVSIFR